MSTPQSQILVIVHQKTSSSGAIGHVLREMGYHLDIRCPAAGGRLPADLSHHEGVIIFGGFMSANDEEQYDFVRQELDWIPVALDSQKPFLGVCLGAQMLAKVLGGRVTKHSQGMAEIGFFPIAPAPGQDVPLFQHSRYVYHWHREGIALPASAVLLATGDTFPTQAFRWGDRAYGVQFHPEMNHELMLTWLEKAADMLSLPGAQSREEQLSKQKYFDEAHQWLHHFLPFWLGRSSSHLIVK